MEFKEQCGIENNIIVKRNKRKRRSEEDPTSRYSHYSWERENEGEKRRDLIPENFERRCSQMRQSNRLSPQILIIPYDSSELETPHTEFESSALIPLEKIVFY